jgi:hypothetical protein
MVMANLVYMCLGMVLLNFLNSTAVYKYAFVILVGLNISAHIVTNVEGLPLLMLNNLFLSLWAG